MQLLPRTRGTPTHLRARQVRSPQVRRRFLFRILSSPKLAVEGTSATYREAEKLYRKKKLFPSADEADSLAIAANLYRRATV